MRDTFLTIGYKGKYIQTCYDRDLKREVVTLASREVKSIHAAKCLVTRQGGHNETN